MEYTQEEQQALALMGRANFAHIKADEMVSLCSRLVECRPEVARDIIAQFPEFTRLVSTSMETYKDILGDIIASDDSSIGHVYEAVERDVAALDTERDEFYKTAHMVLGDISKCLDDPNMSPEDKKQILDQEMDLLARVDAKDTETKQQRKAAISIADRKDSEKRKFNWNIVATASSLVIAAVGIGFGVLGGNASFKLPKKL